ncbi:MAG: cellulase family glycosylhydrolase, partial [bacterium]|nr:cellulase family glycosylhydrolase [bacterium]
RKYLDRGLPVFSVDYCIKKENAALVYARARDAGLRPLVTRVSLARMTETPPPAATRSSAATDRTPITKWSLWTGKVTLRGANIWQARVDDEEVYGGDFGPGPVGPPFTHEDFRRLAAMGANFVNISHPGLFQVKPPYALDRAVQKNLDRLLEMIAATDLFAVIAFRTGPGRSEFTFSHGESREESPREGWFPKDHYDERVWSDPKARKAWASMWRHTAERYRDHRIVVGYDLMVEPNANDTVHGVEEPEGFYPRRAGTLADWNVLYPDIVRAVREVDAHTPILVGAMGHSAVRWLPHLAPVSAPRVVYVVHQYAPEDYTHQDAPFRIRYPGRIDLDGDGDRETFDRDVLEGIFQTVQTYKQRHRVPVAANEMGLRRFQPGAAAFMADQLELFDRHDMNNAVWAWYPDFLAHSDNDDFNFQHGPKRHRHRNVQSSRLMRALRAYWQRNRVRPSQVIFRSGR